MAILEKDIEEILEEKLYLIEDGLRLIKRQFPVDSGFIDILARDKNNTLTIIELKITNNDKRSVWQCAYYPIHFNEPTRIICIAPNYTYKLYHTLLNVKNVEIMHYYFNVDNELVVDKFSPNFINTNTVKDMSEKKKKEVLITKKINYILDNIHDYKFKYITEIRDLGNEIRLDRQKINGILKQKGLCVIRTNSYLFKDIVELGFNIIDNKHIIVRKSELSPAFKRKYRYYIDLIK